MKTKTKNQVCEMLADLGGYLIYGSMCEPNGEQIVDGVWEVAEEIIKERPSIERMVLAVSRMDDAAKRVVAKFSNLAAVPADREDYLAVRNVAAADRAEKAEARHSRRVAAAMDEMLMPAPVATEIRRRAAALLTAANIDMQSISRLAYAIKSRRLFQSVASRNPLQGLANKSYADAVEDELRLAGVTR